MNFKQPWEMKLGKGPIVASAIHNGHLLREEIQKEMLLAESTRLMEEDPFTDRLAQIFGHQIVVHQSRFEYDLNRPPQSAIYIKPEDAWGLKLWKTSLSKELAGQSLQAHHQFYDDLKKYLLEVQKEHPKFIVLDIHSYNHMRDGQGGQPADALQNPEVNVGTGTLDRSRWGHVVDGFIKDMSEYSFMGRQLDVRENIKFKGRYFAEWIHNNFKGSACVLAIEFKKKFMDEWTGILHEEIFNELKKALQSSIAGLESQLKNFQ